MPTIFVILALGFIMIVIALQLAILLAVLPGSRALQLFLVAIALPITGFLYVSTITTSVMFMSSGVGSLLGSAQFWRPAAAFVTAAASLVVLLFTLSVALITPLSANRSLPVRLVMMALWLVTGIVAVLQSGATGGLSFSMFPGRRLLGQSFQLWTSASVMVFSIALLLAVGERESWGPRVTRSIPRRLTPRLLAFLLYSGAGGGVLWAASMIALTLLVRVLLARQVGVSDSTLALAGLGLYAWSYALTAVHLRRWVLARRLPRSLTGLLALGLVAAGSTLPFLVGYLVFYDSWQPDRERIWLFGNPFALDIESHRGSYVFFAALWAAAVGGLALPWFRAQFRRFRSTRELAAGSSEWKTNTAGA